MTACSGVCGIWDWPLDEQSGEMVVHDMIKREDIFDKDVDKRNKLPAAQVVPLRHYPRSLLNLKPSWKPLQTWLT